MSTGAFGSAYPWYVPLKTMPGVAAAFCAPPTAGELVKNLIGGKRPRRLPRNLDSHWDRPAALAVPPLVRLTGPLARRESWGRLTLRWQV